MRKVVVGMGLVAALATFGCSTSSGSTGTASTGGTGGSSGSGGSGTASTGGNSGSGSSGTSSGSSGSSGGAQGSTDTDCGPTHEACWPGESCQDFATAYDLPGRAYACACSDPDTARDSCAGNVTAETGFRNACLITTYRCTAPGSQNLAVPLQDGGFACGEGLSAYVVGTFPDAGDEGICFQPCTTSADCHADFAACFHDIPLDDGSTVDLCVINQCGLYDVPLLDDAGNPELADDGGALMVTQSFGVLEGPCDVDGIYPDDGGGDYSGICVPFGGDTGYCGRGGPRQTGQPCTNDRNGTGDVQDSCVNSDFCYGPFANAPTLEVDGVLHGAYVCQRYCNPGSGYPDGGSVLGCPTDAGASICTHLGTATGPAEVGICQP